MQQKYSYKKNKQFQKKSIFSALMLVGLSIVIILSVSQLDTIREFFSKASGKPADFKVDTQAILGPMPRPWRYLAQGGESHDWRLNTLIPQIKTLNPEYIRLDHIYDFYDIVKGSPGNITFDFSKFDPVIDDILATGAKPYIALSYMPPAISSGDITSPPVRWEDWQLTIQKTIEHLSGTRKIADIYYEVWNEPDLFGGWKYYGERNYLTLYTYAVTGASQAKEVNQFKIGGPAITALYKNWFNALAKHTIKNNLRFDFFSWHRYDRSIERYQQDMAEVNKWIQNYPQLEPTLEFHITEWGHDSEIDIGYDTTYGAAHLAAGAIEMIPTVQKAFIFEIQDGKDPQGQPLWGRWGLFGHEDFGSQPKPRYQALQMLDKISDQRLQITGKGSWVNALAAKNKNNYTELVMANFDPRGSHIENVPITFENIQAGNYIIDTEYLGGRKQQQQIATSAAVLKVQITMPVNSVAFIKLIKTDQ